MYDFNNQNLKNKENTMNFCLKAQLTILSLTIIGLSGCAQMHNKQSVTVVEVAPIAPMPISATPMTDARSLARQAAYTAQEPKISTKIDCSCFTCQFETT